MSKAIDFKCPKCNGTSIEEVMIDVGVLSEVQELELSDDGSVQHSYGEQTNEDGYILRYQCKTCGYVIVDDDSEFAEDGLDEKALVKAIEALNAVREAKGEVVDSDVLLNQISEAHENLDGEELAELFNSLFPGQKVKYLGDSMFEVV